MKNKLHRNKFQKNQLEILLVYFPIIVGGLIYCLFRDKNFIFFKILELIGFGEILLEIRLFTVKIKLSDWIRYCLPDGLYIFSIGNFFFLKNLSKVKLAHKIPFRFLVFLLVSEILQHEYFGKYRISGTFDIFDIYFYIGGYLLSYLIQIFIKSRGSDLDATRERSDLSKVS